MSIKVKKSLIFLILIILLLGISYFIYHMFQSPKVQGSSITFENRTIPYNGEIQIFFNTPMNKESLEKAFSISPFIEGDIYLDYSTLTFKPKDNFEINKQYTVSISKNATSSVGKKLNEDFITNFITIAAPKVDFFSPNDIVVSTDTSIIIMFNQIMFPLNKLDKNMIKNNILFEPKIDIDRIEQIDTKTIKIIPKKLSNATQYTVNIKQGFTSFNNATLEKDMEFKFETEEPKILYVLPNRINRGFNIDPKTNIEIAFNQKIDLDDLKSKINIEPDVNINLSYNKDNNNIVILNNNTLDLDTKYKITIGKGLQGVEGTKTLEKDFEVSFSSVGDMEIVSTIPEDQSYEGNVNGFTLEFSNEYDKDQDFESFISIEPEVKNLNFSIYSDFNLYVYGDLDYSQTYNVVIKKGFQDRYNQVLQKDYNFSFTTKDRPKMVRLIKKNYYNFFSSYEENVYYGINTVNLDHVNFKLCKLNKQVFLNSVYDYNRNYLSNCVEVYEGKINIEKEKNKTVTSYLNISDYFQDSGIYYLEVYNEEVTDDWYRKDSSVVFISGKSITLKRGKNNLLVWTCDLKDGEPVKNINIEIFHLGYNSPPEKLTSGITNDDGVFLYDISKSDIDYNTLIVFIEDENDISVATSNLNFGISAWDFGFETKDIYTKDYIKSFINTDRPIYRPNDTVYITSILRIDENSILSFYPKKNVILEIYNPEYDKIYEKELEVNSMGFISDSFTLDKDSLLGNYEIQLIFDRETYNMAFANFQVQEYTKPVFYVETKTDKDVYIKDDIAKIDIMAEYYYGEKLQNAYVNYSVIDSYYNIYEYKGEYYNFSDYYSVDDFKDNVLSKGRLDMEYGEANLEIAVLPQAKNQNRVFIVNLNVHDQNEQIVGHQVSFPVLSSEYIIGIKNDDFFTSIDQNTKFDIVVLNKNFEPVINKEFKVDFYKREYNEVRKQNLDGEFYYQYEPQDTFLFSRNGKTNDKGEYNMNVKFDDGGMILAKAKVQDRQKNESISSMLMYTYSFDTYFWTDSNIFKLDLISDKQEYNVGDTANILIRAPLDNMNMLITYEKDDILHYDIKSINNLTKTLSIPITKDFIPNTYISSVLFGIDDEGYPVYKLGYSNLKVDNSPYKLKTNLSLDKPTYNPKDEVNLKLNVKDNEGNNVSNAHVIISVVDESLLALLSTKIKNLLNIFYTDSGLGVLNASNMILFTKSINMPSERGEKGGGGDSVSERVRGDFKDTAYYNDNLYTDENGNLEINFELPDNLTTWKVYVYVNSEQHFTSAETKFISQKDMMIVPNIPNFLRANDELVLIVDIINKLDSGIYELEIITDDYIEINETSTLVNMKKDETKNLRFNLIVGDISDVQTSIQFKIIQGDEILDNVIKNVDIKSNNTKETYATSGFIDILPITELIFQNEDGINQKLILSLSSSITDKLNLYFDDVFLYPYECSEQLISKTLFLLNIKKIYELKNETFPDISDRLAYAYKIDKDSTEKMIDTIIQMIINRLYNYKQNDGGFGYWQSSDISHPVLSAYVYGGLNEFLIHGYTVDENILIDARNYLQNVLQHNLSLYEKTYIIYILSKYDIEIAKLYVDMLKEQFDNMQLNLKVLLFGVYVNINNNDEATKISKLLFEYLKDDISNKGNHLEGSINSYFDDIFSVNLYYIKYLMKLNSDDPYIQSIMHWIISYNKSVRYINVKNFALLSRVLFEYESLYKEYEADFYFEVSLNNEDFLTGRLDENNKNITKIADLNKNKIDKLVLEKDDNEYKMYYDINYEFDLSLASNISSKNEGYAINNNFYDFDDNEKILFFVGDVFKGEVEIIVPKNREFVAIEVPLPAGFEIINTEFDTEVKIDEIDDNYMYNWYFDRIEFRYDRLLLFADNLPQGVYKYTYYVKCTNSGLFNVPPAYVFSMYEAERFGRDSGRMINITWRK